MEDDISLAYQKPKCNCGRLLQILTIKSVKLISNVNKQGLPETVDERWIDTEDEYLECKKCRRKYEIVYDNYSKVYRGQEILKQEEAANESTIY